MKPTRKLRSLKASRAEAIGLPFMHAQLLGVFRQLALFERPADEVLHRHFRAEAKIGRRDRHMLAEQVYFMLRHRRRLLHRSEGMAPPEGWPASEPWDTAARLLRAVLEELGSDSWTTPTGQGRAAHANDPRGLEALHEAVYYSLPNWLHQRLKNQAPEDPEAAQTLYAALLQPAALDLRAASWHPEHSGGAGALGSGSSTARPANAGSSEAWIDGVVALLAADGVEAQPYCGVPGALRVVGKPALERTRAFTAGLVEVQDAGSQVIAALLAPRRGQVLVDFCAGAGGKTLALGAALRNTGQVFACDVSASRLARLRPRLQRSGLSNVQPILIADENDLKLGKLVAKADAVLVDVPCSGTGTLRRNPDLKWRLKEKDLGAITDRQSRILRAAARLVRPGGWLVYASCSLLREENEEQVESFLAESPEFAVEPLGPVLEAADIAIGLATLDERSGLHVWRSDMVRDACDGFFAVRMRRVPRNLRAAEVSPSAALITEGRKPKAHVPQ